MPPKSNKKSQVSFSLNEQEKTILTKQSFRQNRSVSQIMRFAIKKYLDGLGNSYMKPVEEDSVEQIFLKLGSQLAKNADILFALNLILAELELKNEFLFFSHLSDNATAITGYDRFDLLNPDFLLSRVNPQQDPQKIFAFPHSSSFWEHEFDFKKPHGEYSKTRISFKRSESERVLASWQFLPDS